MDALLVIDMQVGLLNGDPKHDLAGVVRRINQLAATVRDRSGRVIFVQHCGVKGDNFEPHTPGWALLPELRRDACDLLVRKTLNDPFAGTDLQTLLQDMPPDRVLITGWTTDFCVDATVRSAVTRDYHVVAVADGHTLSSRPHLEAADVIRHHNWVWSELITRRSIKVAATHELIA
jgi:nicotinamidase-related amidase